MSPDLFRSAASYVDRIVKGAGPAELPVQRPTKFELIINLKTANALSLQIPQSLLLLAKIEGNTLSPTLATLDQIAHVLGVPATELPE
jgi:ABC transporter substrate binding protein